MRFKFLSGDYNWETYGGKFISQKLSNGEFDYYIIMDVLGTGNWDGERPHAVQLGVVAPEQVSEEHLRDAFQCWGFEEPLEDAHYKVEALYDYGTYAPVWFKSGSNLRKLLKEARREAKLVEGLFGFYMDRPVNALGATGWDFIEGNVLGVYAKQEVA